MRTIDEVIFFLEDRQKTEDWNVRDDAIQHLREFKELIKMWNDKLDKEQENPPLTWEQLKQMEGKPLWVESHCDIAEFTGWCIVSKALSDRVYFILSHYDDDNDFLTYEMALPDITFGRDWQAYRKEKNEDA